MVPIPGGLFLMGTAQAPDGGPVPPEEQPVREVRVRGFMLGRTPVTFEQFDQYCTTREIQCPEDAGWGRGDRPAINVSWTDAQGYIDWLNSVSGCSYRLPSEAEWEYAARAGSQTAYPWGDELIPGVANCRPGACGDDYLYTSPVGSFPPNSFGLKDMHGNVWEWVEDCWNPGYAGAPDDGSPWLAGRCEWRVLRGGSWGNGGWWLRSAYRFASGAGNRHGSFGFRLAHDLTEDESCR